MGTIEIPRERKEGQEPKDKQPAQRARPDRCLAALGDLPTHPGGRSALGVRESLGADKVKDRMFTHMPEVPTAVTGATGQAELQWDLEGGKGGGSPLALHLVNNGAFIRAGFQSHQH